MRRASATSWSAVNRSTRPIERRYSRSESSDGSTVRSISGFFGCAAPSGPAGGPSTGPAAAGDRRRTRCPRRPRAGARGSPRSAPSSPRPRRGRRRSPRTSDSPRSRALQHEISKLLQLHEARLGGLLQQSDSGLILLRQPSLLRYGVRPPGRSREWDYRVVWGRGEHRDGLAVGGKTNDAAADFGPVVQLLVRFASRGT